MSLDWKGMCKYLNMQISSYNRQVYQLTCEVSGLEQICDNLEDERKLNQESIEALTLANKELSEELRELRYSIPFTGYSSRKVSKPCQDQPSKSPTVKMDTTPPDYWIALDV